MKSEKSDICEWKSCGKPAIGHVEHGHWNPDKYGITMAKGATSVCGSHINLARFNLNGTFHKKEKM